MIVLRGVYKDEIKMYEGEYGPQPEGDLMSVEDYLQSVSEHALMDDDGYGYPVKDNKIDHQLHIWPSEGRNHIPLDATHIIWYNK